jgi:hypothetical protein
MAQGLLGLLAGGDIEDNAATGFAARDGVNDPGDLQLCRKDCPVGSTQ